MKEMRVIKFMAREPYLDSSNRNVKEIIIMFLPLSAHGTVDTLLPPLKNSQEKYHAFTQIGQRLHGDGLDSCFKFLSFYFTAIP